MFIGHKLKFSIVVDFFTCIQFKEDQTLLDWFGDSLVMTRSVCDSPDSRAQVLNLFVPWARLIVWLHLRVPSLKHVFFFGGGRGPQQPPVGQGFLIPEVSRSHTTTHHSRLDSSGRVISSSQRPLPYDTQPSQQTTIHDPGGFRTHNLSR